jgi:hypothetical protein
MSRRVCVLDTKIEGLLGGWKPQEPPKVIIVVIAKLLSLLETVLSPASTPAASTNFTWKPAISFR